MVTNLMTPMHGEVQHVSRSQIDGIPKSCLTEYRVEVMSFVDVSVCFWLDVKVFWRAHVECFLTITHENEVSGFRIVLLADEMIVDVPFRFESCIQEGWVWRTVGVQNLGGVDRRWGRLRVDSVLDTVHVVSFFYVEDLTHFQSVRIMVTVVGEECVLVVGTKTGESCHHVLFVEPFHFEDDVLVELENHVQFFWSKLHHRYRLGDYPDFFWRVSCDTRSPVLIVRDTPVWVVVFVGRQDEQHPESARTTGQVRVSCGSHWQNRILVAWWVTQNSLKDRWTESDRWRQETACGGWWVTVLRVPDAEFVDLRVFKTLHCTGHTLSTLNQNRSVVCPSWRRKPWPCLLNVVDTNQHNGRVENSSKWNHDRTSIHAHIWSQKHRQRKKEIKPVILS